MQYSHSRVDCFESCKFKYKKRYIDRIKTIAPTNADNALYLGTAMHTGIEKDVETAINEYFMTFPIIDDLHINESIKMEYLIPRVKGKLPAGGVFEQKIMTSDFIGFMDYLVPMGYMAKEAIQNPYGEDVDIFDLYDFKYSNNIKNYMESGQLHEYKYFYEKSHPGRKIRNLYFVFIPKVAIKQKKTEDLYSFRQRIMAELEKSEVKIVEVKFDVTKVIDFTLGMKKALEATEFPKEPSYLCNWCDYQNYCVKGEDWMLLPKNERRNIERISKKVVWLYGAPFSGKTFLANKFPEPLMLNTDGNIKFIDSPYLAIKDQVTVEGRMTKRVLAWAMFKETIEELEKKQNDFKTIVVDLLEDVYEHCRVFIYDREGITHESDNSFKYYDVVRTEFLSTLKRLMNMDYENIILISHEDTSKDITKKSGDKITAIKPNIADKVALKVAGMVDIVGRVVADGDERTLSFKTNEVIFGGGRLRVAGKAIPLDYDEFMKVYDEANASKTGSSPSSNTKPEENKSKTTASTRKGRRTKKEETPQSTPDPAADVTPTEDSSAQKVQEIEQQAEQTEPNAGVNKDEVNSTEQETNSAANQDTQKPARKTRKKRGE